MSLLKIASGTVYDPANGVDGVIADLWIRDGRLVAAPADGSVRPDRVIDASGMVVMPGGVDMHCHIAGPKVNTARKMRPEEKRGGRNVMRRTATTRSGTLGSTPSTFTTGYLYTGLGYTTAFDAAVPPIGARHAIEEFEDTPILDKGFFVLMGNNHYVMNQLKANEPERLKAYVAWLLNASGGYASKIVNPGGVENWKSGARNVSSIDDVVHGFDITPRQILRELARTVDELRLPHSVHIHGNNLGLPGNWTTTLDTMRALEGHRGHLTHIQFHSYGGSAAEQSTFCSKVPELAEYINSHPNLTVDVGQVIFGQTTSMTGDGPIGHYLHKLFGRKWFSGDAECEAGCGIVPIEYRDKSLVHTLQWAIGLEWYLLVDDPWRIAMSTDHPNGGSFLAYPEIIALLMDRGRREEMLSRAPAGFRERCSLADLTREYSLYEIAIITRAAPARMLGLTQKGNLGAGADADVTIYDRNDDIQEMFSAPRYVLKAGRVVVENGELRTAWPTGDPDDPHSGRLLHVCPEYDQGCEQDIQDWFEGNYSVRMANYRIQEHELGHHEVVDIRRG
ncbi:MAG TPA: formylmethanofuran dehydrogenase subunit A [Caulifigura sp.]|jgi:formylmethanofuran dehydrogenase subunit A|nr:formylmethanofuran dehydrogenase subunit A [Caulifigura sp.]